MAKHINDVQDISIGFQNPPEEYGEVSFFWWHGDDITKEKLSWILEQLKDKHICGLQINYCHSNEGGNQYGLTMRSNPKPFSQEWWDLLAWFIPACKKYGMAVSLSDYTLCAPGQGYFTDWVLEKYPQMQGKRLVYKDNKVIIESVKDSANPLYPGFGQAIIHEFYEAFERHFPGECGTGINYFFSDELNFNISGNLWTDDFAEVFTERKGYDIRDKWLALFEDIGDETPKIRLDYRDVMVQLIGERYFQPVYEWHQSRGMVFGCDHGGRGYDLVEFGDYFRAMRWYQGPGNDQPGLRSDIIKSKVSASIAHMYKRPRVWLEGYYGSGWATGSEDLADATFRNYALGHNLLSLHGLYYSTHGSMWEWAPPCNHHHMPYWKLMDHFLLCSKRLCYWNSMGEHRCDIGIVYPVAAMEADLVQGKEAADTAFEAGRYLYRQGIDFDFIDFESIERAQVKERKLCAGCEELRMIVIPNMACVRFNMLKKLRLFQENGGIVIFLKGLPLSSDRAGKNDPVLQELVDNMVQSGYHVESGKQITAILDTVFVRDFFAESDRPYYTHRIIGNTDFYYVYRAEKGSMLRFRAHGIPVIWNPWNGSRSRLDMFKSCKIEKNGKEEIITEFKMPFTGKEVLLVSFEEAKSVMNLPAVSVYSEQDKLIKMEGRWNCELLPTMDNTYGDYRLPIESKMISAEARVMQYCFADTQDRIPDEKAGWQEQVYSYAAYFWRAQGNLDEDSLAAMTKPVSGMEPYVYSWRYGVYKDAGKQHSYHGLKGYISDDFLVMGEKHLTYANSDSEYTGEGPYYFFTTFYLKEEMTLYMDMGTYQPEKIWIDHRIVQPGAYTYTKGRHYLLLKYPTGGRTHFILSKTEHTSFEQNMPIAMKWYKNPEIIAYDAQPDQKGKFCWYKIQCPPGTEKIKLITEQPVMVWDDKNRLLLTEGNEVLLLDNIGESRLIYACTQMKDACYAMAVWKEPAQFVCKEGILDLEKSPESQGLSFYSGGMHLSRMVDIPTASERVYFMADEKIGCAMKICVNGKKAAVCMTQPYLCDITDQLVSKENRIDVYAYNTLYPHMKTIPTNYNHPILEVE